MKITHPKTTQCMQTCTRGCIKAINSKLEQNDTPFVLSSSLQSSERRISFSSFLTTQIFSPMAQAAEVQFRQPLAPPGNQDEATQAENPLVVPAQAAPAPQAVQNNADEAQNELEVNSVFFGFLYFITFGCMFIG